MSRNSKLTFLRLEKEERKLRDQPIEHAFVTREGLLNFHFCIYGLDGDYEGGFYHAALLLSEDYPFAPPVLKFYTSSGRFDVGKAICTTFTNYHKQTWSSAWNIRTMITAAISFMIDDSQVGIGSIKSSRAQRKQYASESLAFNLRNEKFVKLFNETLLKNNINITLPQYQPQLPLAVANKDTKVYYFYLMLLVVIFIGVFAKSG